MNKSKRVVWGLIFVAAAILLIASGMGYFHGITFGQILYSTLCGILILGGIINRSFSSFFFGLAFMGIVWDRELGIEQITPWPILCAALLLSIGFSLMFGNYLKNKHCCKKQYVTKNKSYENGEHIFCENKFGDSEKHIESTNLLRADIINKFGSSSIHFDNALSSGDTITVWIDCKFGDLKLFFPNNWKLESEVDCIFGAINIPKCDNCVNDVTIILTGSSKFSNIQIYRV